MRNIIKSQLFGLRHDMFTYISIAIAIVLLITGTIDSLEMFDGTYTGSLEFATMGSFVSMYSIIVVCMFSTRLCGWDFNDKTINYEVLYGHSRSEVCIARIISAVTVSSLLGFFFSIVPVLIFTVVNGWGYALSVGQAVLRSLIFLLSLIRFASVCVLFTFIAKNSWGAFLMSFLLFDAQSMIFTFVEFKSYLTSASVVIDALSFENQSYGFVNGEDVVIFKDVLSGEFIAGSVIISVVVIALALFVSYKLFCKCDMK